MKIFVQDIKENEIIESVFLVKEKYLGFTREGNSYLNLKLADKTGDVHGRIWNNAEIVAKSFDKDDFIKVRARAISYQGVLQLNITEVRRCLDDEINPKEFLPESEKNKEEIFANLKEAISQIKDFYLKRLLELIFADNVLMEEFKQVPAAKGLHHAYLGGLLEHTLNVVNLIQDIAKRYKGINIDLLIAGGILHDIGKVKELNYKRSFDYTDRGRLLGHIVLGVEIVEDKIRQIEGFPDELAMLLKHLIISHHGEYEYESPKRPMTLEALILYYLDDLDAKVECMQSFIKKDKRESKKWTFYHRVFDRFLYKDGGGRNQEQFIEKINEIGND